MRSALFAFASLLCGTSLGLAQGTAFTYQGRLNEAGRPANGSYDFRFRLSSDSLGNNYIGNPWFLNALSVSNGLFTASLEFGAGIFTGSNYWLEVDVRTNGAVSYTVLDPLQALTPAPYAIMANSSSNLLGVLPASQLNGTIANLNLPASPTFSGTITANSFSGNGAGLTNVNAKTLGGLGPNRFWQTGGNSTTTPGPDFVGTTDNQPLELHVNGQRAWRLEPAPLAPNVVGGYFQNLVGGGAQGATISGGGATNFVNRTSSDLSTIAGGSANFIQTNANDAVISGGRQNEIDSGAWRSFIAGGFGNLIQGDGNGSSIGGGYNNTVAEYDSVIAGGAGNTILYAADHSAIGGGSGNLIVGDFLPPDVSDTIAGGEGNNLQTNTHFCVIGGGYTNAILKLNQASTIGGGQFNSIGTNCNESTISGGQGNTIQGASGYSTISGGYTNTVAAYFGSIVGGGYNTASGFAATVAGGYQNSATGDYSLAAGLHANASLERSFVWNSFPNPAYSFSSDRFQVLGTNGFSVDYYTQRPDGGGTRWVEIGPQFAGQTISTWTGAYLSDGGAWVPNSDRARKANFSEVDSTRVLEGVVSMPIQTWNYTNEPASLRHLGPMAQDFHAAFSLNGADDKHIADVDEAGVALAAIQGLNRKLDQQLKAKQAELDELKQKLARLERLVNKLTPP